MQKVKSPPVDLDKYLEGDKKRYLTYEDAARLFIVQLKYQLLQRAIPKVA